MLTIKIDSLRLDGGTQPRENISQATVDEYAQDMRDGAEFPALTVFCDGQNNWLADGYHRYYAALQVGLEDFPAEIIKGSQRDAILYSVGTNGKHGLRRTNGDKRRAVMTLLNDNDWRQLSDGAIAKKCGVSQPFVSNLRKESGHNGYDLTRKGADGKTYSVPPKTEPPAPNHDHEFKCESCGEWVKTRGLSMISKKWLCVDCIQAEIQANKANPTESSDIDPDGLYFFLPAYLAHDKRAHYCKCTATNEAEAWERARVLSPSVSAQRGNEFRRPATANPDMWIANIYDDFCALLSNTPQVEPPALPSPKLYPSPAYCGQCDKVLDGWVEVDYISVKRWQCPKCGINVPDGLMRPDAPKASIFGREYPTPVYCSKCGKTSTGWVDTTIGIGELSAKGWQCPICKAQVPNEEMHAHRRPTGWEEKSEQPASTKANNLNLTPDSWYCVNFTTNIIYDRAFDDQNVCDRYAVALCVKSRSGSQLNGIYAEFLVKPFPTTPSTRNLDAALQAPEQDESNDQLHEMAIAQLEALDKALLFINEHAEFMLGALDEWIEAHPEFDWRMEVEDLISIVGAQVEVEQ